MSGSVRLAIKSFLASEHFAVVGASPDRAKFGNKVLRALVGRYGAAKVTPVHPKSPEVEGIKVQPLSAVLSSHPAQTLAVSIITPPAASLAAVKEAVGAGVTRIWLQPGAEDQAVLDYAKEKGVNVIAGGPCVLVQLGFDDHM